MACTSSGQGGQTWQRWRMQPIQDHWFLHTWGQLPLFARHRHRLSTHAQLRLSLLACFFFPEYARVFFTDPNSADKVFVGLSKKKLRMMV